MPGAEVRARRWHVPLPMIQARMLLGLKEAGEEALPDGGHGARGVPYTHGECVPGMGRSWARSSLADQKMRPASPRGVLAAVNMTLRQRRPTASFTNPSGAANHGPRLQAALSQRSALRRPATPSAVPKD